MGLTEIIYTLWLAYCVSETLMALFSFKRCILHGKPLQPLPKHSSCGQAHFQHQKMGFSRQPASPSDRPVPGLSEWMRMHHLFTLVASQRGWDAHHAPGAGPCNFCTFRARCCNAAETPAVACAEYVCDKPLTLTPVRLRSENHFAFWWDHALHDAKLRAWTP